MKINYNKLKNNRKNRKSRKSRKSRNNRKSSKSRKSRNNRKSRNYIKGGENIIDKINDLNKEVKGVNYISNIKDSEYIHDEKILDIIISDKPIVTNGIATCMGIGMYKDGINYFQHIYDCSNARYGTEWNKLIKEKNLINETMYVLIQGSKLTQMKLDFFNKLENYSINNIKIVDWTIVNNIIENINDYTDYYVGIHKFPISFHKDSEKREEIKLKIDEKKVIDENKKKFKEGSILKRKNPYPSLEKMRWKIIDFHPISGNPQGKIIIDRKGKHATVSSNILLNFSSNILLNFKEYEIDDKYINK